MSDSPLLPEQQKALDYLRRKGTEAPAAQIRRQASEAFDRIETLLTSVPGDLRRRAPAVGRWSPQEILDHLVESHRPAIGQLASLVRGERPAGGAIPAGLQSAEPLTLSWDELFGDLRSVHAAMLDLCERMPDTLPLSPPRAPIMIVVKVAQEDGTVAPVEWLEELDAKAFAQALRAHTLEHVGQLGRTLEALGESAG